ncbi:hypothetical protein FIM07_01440 [SAR202 cluster bacterium AD-802-F09_MRT_200m]|nr:hypothetical protein [SAR202 cluster bacterium AD-802-F09_MRT_200m]
MVRVLNILVLGPDGRNKSIIEFLKARGNDVSSTTEEVTVGSLQQANIEFMISSGYAPILKEPVVSVYRHRIINLHISYLPYGKGIAPNFWSFFEGTPNGVTIHFINAGIDSGEIICQKRVEFHPDDTLETSHTMLMKTLETFFMDQWQSLIDNDFKPVSQVNLVEKGTYHNRLESEGFLDLLPQRWQTPVSQVRDLGTDVALSGNFWDMYDQSVGEANG